MAYSELGIKLTADDKAFLQSLKNIEAKISGLSKNKVKLDVTVNNTAIPKLQQQLSSIKPPKLKFEDIKPLGGLDKLNAQLEATKLRYEGMFSKSNVNLSSIKNAENQIGSLKQRINDFGQTSNNALPQVASGFNGIGTAIKGLGATIGVLLSLQQALSFIKDIVSVNIALEDSFVNVKRTVGATADEMKLFEDQLLELSKSTRTPIDSLIEIAQVGGQLGIATKDILPFVESIDKANVALSADFKGNAEEVTKAMGGLRNVLNGVKTDNIQDDFLKISNSILALGNAGQATGPFIADVANRIAGLAPGAKAEEILGLSAALQELNITAERGGSSVGRLLDEISKPTEFDKEGNIIGGLGLFAQQVGIAEDEFKKLVNTSQTDALLLVAESFNRGDTSATGFSEKLQQLGLDGVGITEVFSKFAKNADLVRDKVDLAGKSLQETTGITKAYDESNNTTQANLDKLGNQWQAYQKQLGEGLTNPFSGLIKSVTDAGLENIFNGIIKDLSTIGSTIMAILDPFGLLQGTLSILQTGFNNLIGIITNVFKAFQDPKVQEALGRIWTALEPIRNVIGKIKDAVLGFFENLTNGSKEGSESLYTVDNIVNVLSTTFNILADTINIVIGVITSLITWLQQSYNTASWFVTSTIEFFNSLYTNVSTSITNIYNAIVDWFTKALDFVNETINNIIQFFTDLPGNIINAIGNIADVFSEWINGALSVGTQIRDGILNGLGNIAGDISSKVSGALSGTTNAIGSGFNSIGSALGFSEGGLVPQYLSTGGVAGGSMFKSKGTDTVPAMLTPGEFVVNKKSVDTLGHQFMDILNTDASKVKYALNGLLSAPDRLLTSAGSSNNSFITNDNKEVNINVNYNNSSANPHTLLYQLNSLIGSSL
jgi:TP901 family phage tail tape measure protein